jgi:hypothetical protein
MSFRISLIIQDHGFRMRGNRAMTSEGREEVRNQQGSDWLLGPATGDWLRDIARLEERTHDVL